MRIESTIVKEKDIYEIKDIINNTALVKSTSGKYGLLNIKTNELICEFKKNFNVVDKKNNLFIQWNNIDEDKIYCYDALNEKMIINGWEFVRTLKDFNLFSVISPKRGKMHLFDIETFRETNNIFKSSFDDIDVTNAYYCSFDYLIVEKNGKKGIYHCEKFSDKHKMASSIEYDDIKFENNIMIFTKDNKKSFRYYKTNVGPSFCFDSIKKDEKSSNIIYCKKGKEIYVYNTLAQVLLFNIEADQAEYLYKSNPINNEKYGEFVFKVKRDEKYGLIASETNRDINKKGFDSEVTILLDFKYDEMKNNQKNTYLSDVVFFDKDEKKGFFKGNAKNHQIVNSEYDEIKYISNEHFILKKKDSYELQRINKFETEEPILTDIQSYECFTDCIKYQKNNKYGLVYLDTPYSEKDIVIDAEYDDIYHVTNNYFIVTKDGKKGIMHSDELIVPCEYNNISFGGYYESDRELKNAKDICFALQKEKQYNLVFVNNTLLQIEKIRQVFDESFDSIDLLRDIIVIKDNNQTFIYDYNKNFLTSMPGDVEVTSYEKNPNSRNKEYFYIINGETHCYKDGKLLKVYLQDINRYVTTFEIMTRVYELSAYDKSKYDKFCDEISTMDDIDAEYLLTDTMKYGKNSNDINGISLRRIK